MHLPSTLYVWPSVEQYPPSFAYHYRKHPDFEALRKSDEDFFGVSARFAEGQDGRLHATNEIDIWLQNQPYIGVSPAKRSYDEMSEPQRRLLFSLIGDKNYGMRIPAVAAFRKLPVPREDYHREVEVIRTRNAFIATDIAVDEMARSLRREVSQDDREQLDVLQKTIRREQHLEPSAHIDLIQTTNDFHFGAALLTVVVDTPPDSNHRHLEWAHAIHSEVADVLAHRALTIHPSMKLHPAWSIPKVPPRG